MVVGVGGGSTDAGHWAVDCLDFACLAALQ